MGATNKLITLEDNIELSKDLLQEYYWQFVNLRKAEIVQNKLTARVTVEFSAGVITKIYDNRDVAGVSAINYYTQQLVP